MGPRESWPNAKETKTEISSRVISEKAEKSAAKKIVGSLKLLYKLLPTRHNYKVGGL
jgi:hypothetical protein